MLSLSSSTPASLHLTPFLAVILRTPQLTAARWWSQPAVKLFLGGRRPRWHVQRKALTKCGGSTMSYGLNSWRNSGRCESGFYLPPLVPPPLRKLYGTAVTRGQTVLWMESSADRTHSLNFCKLYSNRTQVIRVPARSLHYHCHMNHLLVYDLHVARKETALLVDSQKHSDCQQEKLKTRWNGSPLTFHYKYGKAITRVSKELEYFNKETMEYLKIRKSKFILKFWL